MNVGLKIAQDFNREVLKGQLNPEGDTVKELARRIDYALDETKRIGTIEGYSGATR